MKKIFYTSLFIFGIYVIVFDLWSIFHDQVEWSQLFIKDGAGVVVVLPVSCIYFAKWWVKEATSSSLLKNMYRFWQVLALFYFIFVALLGQRLEDKWYSLAGLISFAFLFLDAKRSKTNVWGR